jgi:hypothetical protein
LEVKVEGQIATITFSEYSGVKEIEAHLVPMAMDVSSDGSLPKIAGGS